MTEENVLKILQKSADFISGEDISARLGISRTAVWKAVNKLRAGGYSVESVTRRGYRLAYSADVLTEAELGPLCQTETIGKSIVHVHSCASTNDAAKEGGLRGDPEGTVYTADIQTNGRGRMGRSWHCGGQDGIALSILLRPQVPPTRIMPLSLLSGLCACKALESATGLPCQVKWPNDVVVRGRKVAGVLIEMSTVGEAVQFLVVGTGINVNHADFPEEIRGVATSVRLETGRTFSRKAIACELLKIFEEEYLRWARESAETSEASPGKARTLSCIAEYKSRCVNLGETVVIHSLGQVFSGTAKDITPDGELTVVLPDGQERVLASGEISLRSAGGYA